MKAVSNSTPLIALSRINELELLHTIFGTIIIPSAVYDEVVLEGAGRPGVKEVTNASWIIKLEHKRSRSALKKIKRMSGTSRIYCFKVELYNGLV